MSQDKQQHRQQQHKQQSINKLGVFTVVGIFVMAFLLYSQQVELTRITDDRNKCQMVVHEALQKIDWSDKLFSAMTDKIRETQNRAEP